MSGSVIRRAGLVSAAALFACWSNAQGTQIRPVGSEGQPLVQAGPSSLEGEYWCSISVPPFDGTQNRYEYPKMPCTIRSEGGQLVLTKHAGSQRFTGAIVAQRGGFTFDGKFFCPWGACDQPLHGEFRGTAQGELLGTFSDDKIEVHLVRAQPGAFGGGGYGGAAYGGGSYGGFGYGGAAYGGRVYGGFHKPRRH